jgi:short-subunit dehydrogenase
VTGASRSIGKEIRFSISESDADVVVTVRVKKLDKVSFQ